MNLKQHTKKAGFDRIAGMYRLLETVAFGSVLQRARTAHLGQITDAKEVLLVGEGNGLFLESLLSLNSHCRVTCIDKSQKMLNLARNRIKKTDEKRVRFEQIDLNNSFRPSTRHDALVTHFLLDCFTCQTLKSLLPQLVDCLRPDGRWLLADFVDPPKEGVLASFQRSALRLLYAFFKSTCGIEAHELCNPREILFSLGMRETKRQTYLQGWIASLVYEKTVAKKESREAVRPSIINSQKALTLVA